MKQDFQQCLNNKVGFKGFDIPADKQSVTIPFVMDNQEYTLKHGSVVIAAITSCTNTSNPSVMLGAGEFSEGVCISNGLTYKSKSVLKCIHHMCSILIKSAIPFKIMPSVEDFGKLFFTEGVWILNRLTIGMNAIKSMLYVYKCLTGLGPDYSASSLAFYIHRRHGFWSASDSTHLHVPKLHHQSFKSAADKAFASAAPELWNQLLVSVRSSNSLPVSKKTAENLFVFRNIMLVFASCKLFSCILLCFCCVSNLAMLIFLLYFRSSLKQVSLRALEAKALEAMLPFLLYFIMFLLYSYSCNVDLSAVIICNGAILAPIVCLYVCACVLPLN